MMTPARPTDNASPEHVYRESAHQVPTENHAHPVHNVKQEHLAYQELVPQEAQTRSAALIAIVKLNWCA